MTNFDKQLLKDITNCKRIPAVKLYEQVMKKITLILICIIIWIFNTFGCKCPNNNFRKECSKADNIYVGRVIEKKSNNTINYKIKILGIWKGDYKDTVFFSLGKSDCDIILDTGETYLIFAEKNYAPYYCSSTNKYRWNKYISMLNRKFKKNIFIPESMLNSEKLSIDEALYINERIFNDKINKVFENEKYLFKDTLTVLENNIMYYNLEKNEYYQQRNKYSKLTLIKFTNNEKKKMRYCYDGIIVLCEMKNISEIDRKKIIKKMPCP
jgi:hypothetical protein